jgi:hypothetical protein
MNVLILHRVSTSDDDDTTSIGSTMPLPKYFIRHADHEGATPGDHDPFLSAHVVDSFFLNDRHSANREWVVMTDIIGALRAVPADLRNGFSPWIQAELAHHELSSRVSPRVVAVEGLFLFDVQVVEQPNDTPGPNDPVYLYGILYGPYANSEDTPVSATKGQLTVTRADVLDGFVQGAAHAFRYTNSADLSELSSCCFHMLLPGDRQEELQCGRGVVLAYPLLPAQLAVSDASNESVVKQLLYDLLSALKEDVGREVMKNPLRAVTLPVPSRSNLERQLEFEGYTINGDTAISQVPAGKGFRRLLAAAFGALMQERLNLPPEGNVDDFLKIASAALHALPGWPSPRALALRERMKPVSMEWRNPSERFPSPPRQARFPTPGSSPPPAPPTRVHLPPMSEAGELPAWMQDFIDAHRKPGAPSPRLTSLGLRQRQELPPRSSAAKQQQWMHDFEPKPTPPSASASNQPDPPVKPNWMKDFE